MSTREPDFSPRPDPYAGSYPDLDPADAHVLALLDRDIPPMGVDLDAIATVGRRRVLRRRATIGAAVASALTAGAVGLATLLAPHASVGIPAGQSTPTPSGSFSGRVAADEHVVPEKLRLSAGAAAKADGAACRPVAGDALAAGDVLDLSGSPQDKVFQPALQVMAGSPAGQLPMFFWDNGGPKRIALTSVRAGGGVLRDFAEVNNEPDAQGAYDGEHAVFGPGVVNDPDPRQVMIRLWDAATGQTRVIGAADAEGWRPSSPPVLGGGVAIWMEQRFEGSTPVDDHRLVRYHLDSGARDTLTSTQGEPIGVVGDSLWIQDDRGDLVRVAALGRGERSVVGPHLQGGGHVAASDGKTIVWVSENGQLMASDGGEARVVADLGAGMGVHVRTADGLAVVQLPYPGGSVAEVVVDLATGAHLRTDGTPITGLGGGAVLLSQDLTRGRGVARARITQADDWREALRKACS